MTTTRSPRSGPVGVGVIGAGMISQTYLENLMGFPDVEVLIVGDLDPDRARERVAAHGIPGSGTADDVLAHPDVELVVNLTIPAVHAEVSAAAVAAGKHVWSEKPIGIDRESSARLLAAAAEAGLLVAVAPDTVYGPGLQTARRVIERGDIGTPLSAQTVFQWPGPELFHPNPAFLYAAGAGPLFDTGPYYLTALAHIFGPFARVAAFGSKSRATRAIAVGELAGTEFDVVAPSHVSAIASFTGGGVSQSVLSFDSPLTKMGYVEITGTDATLLIPDPNFFSGRVRFTRGTTLERLHEDPEWIDVDVADETFGRGAGALDLARCIRNGGTPIASGELGYHILDVMVAMEESMTTGEMVAVESTIPPVPLLPEGWDPRAATLG